MKPTAAHLDSLDVFRGLAVASMIVVNNPGAWDAVFDPFEHAPWNTTSFADFVFPAFIFIMGIAMPFAFARHSGHGDDDGDGESGGRHSRGRVYRRLALRVIALIALGIALNATAGFPSPADLRIPGVLQRIAMVYLITAVVVLQTRAATQAAIAAGLLLVHWVLLTAVPFGGHPAGIISPQQNLSAFVDAWLFGAHRIMPLDPEGALGTLSAAALALIGALAGQWLRAPLSRGRQVIGLIAGGLVLLGFGLAWSAVLPLNKPLWTGSFTLVTAGAAVLGFAICHLLIDVGPLMTWARPFTWLGANPLAIYALSELTGHLMDQGWLSSPSGPTTMRAWLFGYALDPWVVPRVGASAASLLFAVAFTALWVGVAGVLHHQRIRIRL